jgi:hypothetical protein
MKRLCAVVPTTVAVVAVAASTASAGPGGGLPEAPLQKYDSPLHWDTDLGIRVR